MTKCNRGTHHKAGPGLRINRRVRPPEDEINRAHHAHTRPNVAQPEGLIHVDHGKWHKRRQRDHLLHDFELPHVEARLLEPDAVGRHLQQVLQQRNAPAHQGCDVPGLSPDSCGGDNRRMP